jgi:hypothetical protein
MGGKSWTETEIRALTKLYKDFTIKELMEIFPNRTEDSINTMIHRLKGLGEIRGGKKPKTRIRAMKQRDLRFKSER